MSFVASSLLYTMPVSILRNKSIAAPLNASRMSRISLLFCLSFSLLAHFQAKSKSRTNRFNN
jgi:hypothetical protein